MYYVSAWRQMDAIPVLKGHFAVGPHGDRFGQTGLMHMEKRVRSQMFGHADLSGPRTFAIGHRDMLGAHTDCMGAMFRGLLPFDEVHLG